MQQTSRKILFIPISAYGHVHGCLGLSSTFQASGHSVYFALPLSWKGKFTQYGINEITYGTSTVDANEQWIGYFKRYASELPKKSIDKLETFDREGREFLLYDLMEKTPYFETIIQDLQPDVIIVDNFIPQPAVIKSGIPWVWHISLGPSCITPHPDMPPPWSGYPTKGDRREWDLFRQESKRTLSDVWKRISDFMVQQGGDPLPEGHADLMAITESPYLNLYISPEELDYLHIRPAPQRWLRIDAGIRETQETFQIPQELQEKHKKWIFLSMGSIGSVDVDLMRRLTTLLAYTPYGCIVSTGPRHSEYTLPANMCGAPFVPQIAVLPLVDLVICHAGHNTVNEALYFAKPIVALPLFADQVDIAQRLQESGLGRRLGAYDCGKEELLGVVEELMGDGDLKLRLGEISNKLKKSTSRGNAVQAVIDLCKKK